MATKNVELYFFETIEKVTRFIIHLDDLENQFYSDGDDILKDKLSFIFSYKDCLLKLIEVLYHLMLIEDKLPKNKKEKEILLRLEEVNLTLNKLQSKLLIHLPRPTEPVELRRFCRVIYKQIIKLDEKHKDQISIYVNEGAEDNTYASDPLMTYKEEDINPLISSLNNLLSKINNKNEFEIDTIQQFVDNSDDKTIHISIPRLDANNPCHWPTLIHEVSHNLMREEWFNNVGIYEDFKSTIRSSGYEENISRIEESIDLKSWLIECWCDLFACALIGPSFYFSQYVTFLHSLEYNNNKKYPPRFFRLNLIERFLAHRFSSLYNDPSFSQQIFECKELLLYVDQKNNLLEFENNEELVNLFMIFSHYFLRHFFILDNGALNFKNDELRRLFANISPFVNRFDLSKIESLINSLNQGFPIPSYREPSDENLTENPNYVQEIFISSWMFRNNLFKNKILKNFKSIKETVTDDKKTNLLNLFEFNIVKEFKRFDQSILRSIQISEWVDLLMDGQSTPNELVKNSKEEKIASKLHGPNLLVDKEIFSLLEKEEIKVIPLINVKKQLGSTSLDIRLGTSFEVYFPNRFGIVDFTDSNTLNKMRRNSQKINLDFLKSIPINPGQFMLGHSLEYIKLPKYISSDLEGRSSFARLGIQIHMTAGFVDPGFEGVLTFEIHNSGTNPIMLYPGLRIGQLRFIRIEEPIIGYNNRHTAKYKGWLEHHFSLHGEDYEIQRISEARIPRNLRNNS